MARTVGGRWSGAKTAPRKTLYAAAQEDAVARLRPKIMTVVSTIGGRVTSTVLTLIVIPVIYTVWRERQLKLTTTESS